MCRSGERRAERRAESGGEGAGRRRRKKVRLEEDGGSREQRLLRKKQKIKPPRTSLTNHPQNNWPHLNNQLSMQLVDSIDGVNFFAMHWSEEYKKSQERFYACVNTGDPNSLAMVIFFFLLPVRSKFSIFFFSNETCAKKSAFASPVGSFFFRV
jgi:hypothetical protein